MVEKCHNQTMKLLSTICKSQQYEGKLFYFFVKEYLCRRQRKREKEETKPNVKESSN